METDREVLIRRLEAAGYVPTKLDWQGDSFLWRGMRRIRMGPRGGLSEQRARRRGVGFIWCPTTEAQAIAPGAGESRD